MSAVMFGAVIGAVTIAHYALGLNAVLAFWIAYILTRPFGASCGDLLRNRSPMAGLAWARWGPARSSWSRFSVWLAT